MAITMNIPLPEAEPAPTVFIVDDDPGIRHCLRAILEDHGRRVRDFASGEEFIQRYRPVDEGCLLADFNLPGMDGVDLLRTLNDSDKALPTIIITGAGCIPMAVEAMRAGAADVVEKPIGIPKLLACIDKALDMAGDISRLARGRQQAAGRIARLTPRQQEIMEMVLAGHPSKNIAADLGISQRTVENHRAVIMKKTGAKSLPALARLAIDADFTPEIDE
jgi:two-component system CheB/CheR fusion protein